MTAQHSAHADAIEELVTDHREVEEMFAELEQLPTAEDGADAAALRRRKDLIDQVTMEVVRHSVAEEEYLYPATKKVLPDYDVEHDISEHSQVEKTLNELDKLTSDDPDFERHVNVLMPALREHIREEETQLFPRLRDVLSAEELNELGEKLRKAKRRAPTRPHPAAPDHPPFNKLLAPGAGVVDRLRDAITKRGKED